MDIENKLTTLRTKVETAKQSKLRAEMEAETALKEREAALKTLKEEFGVSSVEEANKVLTDLRSDLDSSISEAEAILKELS